MTCEQFVQQINYYLQSSSIDEKYSAAVSVFNIRLSNLVLDCYIVWTKQTNVIIYLLFYFILAFFKEQNQIFCFLLLGSTDGAIKSKALVQQHTIHFNGI